MRWLTRSIILVNVLVLMGLAQAREVTVGGQVRPRFEFRSAGGGHDMFTSMRVRSQVKAALERDIGVFIQLQDVRLWGEEGNTLGDFSSDNLDLHQGYFELRKINGSALSVRVGRQEIALGGQRLIGAVGWAQQARSMDGLRFTLSPEGGTLDLIAVRLADATAVAHANNAYLFGGYGKLTRMKGATLDLYALYNRASGGADTDQTTLGLRLAGKGASLVYWPRRVLPDR